MPQFKTIEDAEAYYKGITFAGPEGKPLVVTDLTFSMEEKDETTVVKFLFESMVASKLVNKYNPAAGSEPVEVESISVMVGIKEDAARDVQTLNKAFKLTGKDALVADDEWMFRLTPEHPRSVYDKIVGNANANLYATAKVSPKGDSYNLYWNFFAPAVQQKLSLDALTKALGKGGTKAPF